jgi:hypothetical protein
MRRGVRLDLASVAGALSLVGSMTVADAGGFIEPSASAFRVTWQPRAYGMMPGLEGRVENDSSFRVNAVRLRVEGFDDAGQPVGETSTWVFGSIPARGQGHFVVPSIPRAATYRITVSAFDRVAREDPPQGP